MSDLVLLDATTLISLGSIGELDLLLNFDGDLVVPERVGNEVTSEPASTNLDNFLDRSDVALLESHEGFAWIDRASSILDVDTVTGDVVLVANVLKLDGRGEVAVVSDNRRVRTVCAGLGATVTGTLGVVVHAVHDGLDVEEGTELVRRIDSHGLHMTGELRDTAYDLLEDAAADRD